MTRSDSMLIMMRIVRAFRTLGASMTIRTKLTLTCLLIAATTVVIFVLMKSSIDRVKINGPLYQSIIKRKDLITDLLPPPACAIDAYLVVLQALVEKDGAKAPLYTERLEKLQRAYKERHRYWANELPAGDIKNLLINQSAKPATLFFDTALNLYVPALAAGDYARAAEIVDNLLTPTYEAQRVLMDRIIILCDAERSALETRAAMLLYRSNVETITIGALFLGMILCIFFLMTRNLTRQLRQAIAVADTIAAGDVRIEIEVSSNDEIGLLMAAMKKMVETIRLLITDFSMLTDAAIAGNLATRADVSLHRGDFRKIVTGVNATLDTVIGPLRTAADCLHKLGVGEIPNEITGEYPGDYEPIKTGANAVITMVRMRSRDLELLSTAALQGNLALRSDVSRYSGYHYTMINSINEILDHLTRPLRVAATYVDRIARGDIPPKITDTYHGDFNVIKNNLNNCIDIMNNLLDEATRVLKAETDGVLDERADADLFVGEWRQLVLRINNIVANIVNPLRQTTELLNQEILERRTTQELLQSQQLQLEELNDELEERVAHEAQKNRDKDRALMHNEKMVSLGHLAAGVSHEINNPLTYITGNLRILAEYFDDIIRFCRIRREADGAPAAPLIREVGVHGAKSPNMEEILDDGSNLIRESLEGVERITTIIQDMKSFSRMDAIHMQPMALAGCLEKALNICRNELKYVAAIRKEFEPGTMVLCHPGQLNQVFVNLLVNAGQSMVSHGEILLKCRHDEAFVYASVSDTGSGIPDDILERIFDPFFTTKEDGKGTGLGLSISHEIIKNHHGELLVESVVGGGTTFTVKLPRAPEEKG